MRLLLATTAAAGTALAVVACGSAFTASGGQDAGQDGLADGQGAGDDADIAGNLVTNGGFEQGVTNCLHWSPFGAVTATVSLRAHDGMHSCQVCSSSAANTAEGIVQTVILPDGGVANGVSLSAFVTRPVALPYPMKVQVQINAAAPDGGARYSQVPYSIDPTRWVPVAQGISSALAGSLTVNFDFGENDDAGACFLVDDVSLTAIQ